MLEHLHALASDGMLIRDDRKGLTWLNRPVEAEVPVDLVFDLHRPAVLERDPVQPVALRLVTIARDQNRPSLTQMLLSPLSPSSSPRAR
jgi:hypothetical protein